MAKRRKILIVDDEQINIDIVIGLLNNTYDVISEISGRDTIRTLTNTKVDLILLDIFMSDMNGYEVCKKLKENILTQNIPVMFITANHDENSIEKAYAMGATDYITKPFKPKELLAKVKRELAFIDLVYNLQMANQALEESKKEILHINKNLAHIVEDEIKKNKHKQVIMAQQSRHAQMGEMISMIAHQWKQPLTHLSLIIQSVIIKYQLGKSKEEILSKLSNDANKQIILMSQTIDDFRNFFKPNKNPQVFSLNNSILHAVRLIESSLTEHSIVVETTLNENIFVTGFSNELGQSLINILNNAQDALIKNNANKEKNIFITLEKEQKTITITIRDNAGGIHNDILHKIFEPYFTTKKEKNGTGLGLYLTKTIIEEHCKGKLSVSNTHDGVNFKIILHEQY